MAFYDGGKYVLCLRKKGATSNCVALAGETTSTLNLTCDALEISDKTSPWRQYIAGMRGASINVTVYADDSDTAQKTALDALTAGDMVEFQLMMGQTIKADGEALITSIGMSYPNGAVATRDMTLQVSGSPTLS